MSVLTDSATHGILNSELTNVPRTAAELGELAAQWQHMIWTLQRVQQETVSSQSLTNAVENMSNDMSGDRVITESDQRCREHEQDTDRRDRKPTTIEGRRATLPEELVGQHTSRRFAREVAAWLGHVDPKHEAGKLIQRITKGALRATEAWTDGRHAEDDKHVDLDYELAVALAKATEGVARSLKWTQFMASSHGKHWSTATRPSHRMTQLLRCSPYSRHLKDAWTQRN